MLPRSSTATYDSTRVVPVSGSISISATWHPFGKVTPATLSARAVEGMSAGTRRRQLSRKLEQSDGLARRPGCGRGFGAARCRGVGSLEDPAVGEA